MTSKSTFFILAIFIFVLGCSETPTPLPNSSDTGPDVPFDKGETPTKDLGRKMTDVSPHDMTQKRDLSKDGRTQDAEAETSDMVLEVMARAMCVKTLEMAHASASNARS